MFYLHYAARNLWRNRRWSAFAIFSIAAGVAAIVALRSLGLAIEDSLVNNVRASNKGDLTVRHVSAGSGFNFSFSMDGDSVSYQVIDATSVGRLREWAEARGGSISGYFVTSAVQVTAVDAVTAGRPQFIETIFIDPATYPPTGDLRALDPTGVPLRDLFNGGDEVVISANLAESQGIAVGDTVRVSGTDAPFTVRGIVATDIEASFESPLASFFGFAYIDIARAESLSQSAEPNHISIALPEDQRPATREEADQLATEARRQIVNTPVTTRTVPQLMERNQLIGDVIGRFIVVMGLGALLIGGVGIVNTMLVMVRRRTEEIAALKTFGLKGRQVGLLFMAEALLLGIVGSLFGGGLGVLLAGLANAYGETLIQQPLAWRLYPEAIGFGLVLGVVIAVVFGVLPVITAVKIRPNIILRPNEAHMVGAGVFQSLLALLFVVLAVGIIAGQIVGNLIVGLIGVAVTLLILGLLIGLLWLLVWVVGRLPALGSVDLRLALRNLRSRRLRTATTLLAISAGMFALSSISFFGAGVREILQITLSQQLGGNVLVVPLLPGAIANTLIDNRLDQLDGVNARTRLLNYSASVAAVDGRSFDAAEAERERRRLLNAMQQAARAQDFARMSEIGSQLNQLTDLQTTVTSRETTGTNYGVSAVQRGRVLTAEDRGRAVAVVNLSSNFRGQALGIDVGSQLTLLVQGREYTFEVVGLNDEGADSISFNFNNGDIIVPPGVLPTGLSASSIPITLVDVAPEAVDSVLLSLSALPLVFSLDITFIDGLLRRFIDQFSALPILVGLLSLGAAAVIMANTVALATLERRRQIGILKAVGLKGRRVLGVMLLENVLISLLGGVLGVGLSALGIALLSLLGLQEAILIPTDSLPVALALIVAAIVIGAAATVASAQVAINERALNVLRYE